MQEQPGSLEMGSCGHFMGLSLRWQGLDGQPEQPFAPSLGKILCREHIWAPQSPSQWDDVVVGRAGGWGWGSMAAGALCNRKLPAGDPSRAAFVADLIIQTILFCFSK